MFMSNLRFRQEVTPFQHIHYKLPLPVYTPFAKVKAAGGMLHWLQHAYRVVTFQLTAKSHSLDANPSFSVPVKCK